jgi:orotidine 5'-phosphate decarboxylase subfamily 2
MSFFENLESKNKNSSNRICIGIDPHKFGLSPFIVDSFASKPLPSLQSFCRCLIETAATTVASIKFQSAFFEAFGPDGTAVLQEAIQEAKKKDLLVILDNKRGDISSTMAAYGEASFNQLNADAITVTPYMGLDCLEPLTDFLKGGKAVYVVWKTSNPGAKTLQNTETINGDPYFMHVLNSIFEWAEKANVSESIGYVLGATVCEEIPIRNRADVIKKTKGRLLMPGFGAQGAEITPSLKALTASNKHLIPVSRGVYKSPSALKSWEDFKVTCQKNIEKIKQDLAGL